MSHIGHRQRMIDRFLSEGLESFSDYQILELLLFFSIPRKDTNEIAHNLIDTYGSLKGVLDSNAHALQNIDGIGKNSSVLITLIPQIISKYMKCENNKSTKIHSVIDASNYVKTLFVGKRNEEFYLICLDIQNKVIFTSKISEGVLDETQIYPKKLVYTAMTHNAKSVILTHNHPGGICAPSNADINATNEIVSAFIALDIDVLDHIIVSDSRTYSFAASSKMPNRQLTNNNTLAQKYIITPCSD